MTKQELEQARAQAGAEWSEATVRVMAAYVELVALDIALSNARFNGHPMPTNTFGTPPALPDHPLFRLPDFGNMGRRIDARHAELIA